MITTKHILELLIAYLIGAIPSSVWIGQIFYDIDVREYGSGNAGATNTFRVLGKKAGVPVLLIDIFKGWLAVYIAHWSSFIPGTDQFVNFQLVLGLAALLGHIFPVYVGFRGGKGIATLLGVIFAVLPYAALVSIGIFLAVYLISGYVSLGSITAAISFPFVVIVFFKTSVPSLVIFSLLIAVLVVLTHQKNIERLLRREEAKTRLYRKKNDLEIDEND